MQLNPYLFFNGQCETAFKFYEQCLGGKITAIMTYGESPDSSMPDQLTPEWRNKIMHANLTIGDQQLMGSDSQSDCSEEGRCCMKRGWGGAT